MIVALTGATGFIGRNIVQKLRQREYRVIIIEKSDFQIPGNSVIETKINGCDILINLAGAPVGRKWTPEIKHEILASRVETTRALADAILKIPDKPSLFISSSAVGIYNSSDAHKEDSTGFSDSYLAKVCQEWEKEAQRTSGTTRLVIFRLGVVLGKNGGALEKLEKIFRVGLGGKLGSGEQAFSFIHMHDLMNAFLYTMDHPEINGIVNLVAPYPSTNREFTDKLGKVFGQPAFFRVPVFALKLAYGEGARVLLDGQRVYPGKLVGSGFRFEFPTIQKCLIDIFS